MFIQFITTMTNSFSSTALQGKNVVITGGSRGIGRAIVLQLAKMGARVAFSYHNNKSAAEKVMDELRAIDQEGHIYLKADLSIPDQAKNMVSEIVNQFGKIDILVNNAGTLMGESFMDITEKAFQYQMNTNVLGAITMSQEVIKTFKNGGNIIHVSSIVAKAPPKFGISVYSMTKAAISNLTISMARELAGKKIRVNAVAPGGVLTEMGEVVPENLKQMFFSGTPLEPRFAQPEEIANVVAFLASPASYWINGKILTVDGGYNVE